MLARPFQRRVVALNDHGLDCKQRQMVEYTTYRLGEGLLFKEITQRLVAGIACDRVEIVARFVL